MPPTTAPSDLAALDLALGARPSMGQDALAACPDAAGQVETLAISRPYGRLGNNFYQLLNATLVAQAMRLRRVEIPPGMAGIDAGARAHLGGLLVAPGGRTERAGRLTGSFYVPYGCEGPMLALPTAEADGVARALCDALYAGTLARADGRWPIAVAFRAGDVFVAGPDTPIAYTQPPAAYYLKAIDHALRDAPGCPVDLVYGDRANPAIALVEEALGAAGARFRSLEAGMAENFDRLVSAATLISCPSTFAEAAAIVSRRLRRIYSFRDHCSQSEFRPFMQARLAIVLGSRGVRAFLVDDVSRTYTNKWQWAASPAQVRAITTFDAADLRLFESL